MSLLVSVPLFGAPCAVMADPLISSTEKYSKVVILKYSDSETMGALLLIQPERRAMHGTHKVAIARGKVTLSVPRNLCLMYEANQSVLMHPELINKLPTDNIDVVRLAFMSMDSGEEQYCDNALPYASRFSQASYLSVSNSDASDAGIISIKSMPNLKGIWAASSSVRGRFLENLDRFPNLEELDLSGCSPLDRKELKNLSKIPKLKRLYLNGTGIDSQSLKDVSLCKSLRVLELQDNKKIDDSGLNYLASLRNLTAIALYGTSIDTTGLASLRNLRLEKIVLPGMSYTSDERNHLKELFHGARLVIKDNARQKINAEYLDGNKIFEPLRF